MQSLTIEQIKKLFQQQNNDLNLLKKLKNDHRKGVQKLVKHYEKKQQVERKRKESFLALQQFDQSFQQTAKDYIAGVDEAGRGPLAGPVVAAAVILPLAFQLIGLNDSKQLTENKRQIFYKKIVAEAVSYDIAVIDHRVIDEINIYEATKKAMIQAITQLEFKPNRVLVDAVPLTINSLVTESIVKGDEKSLNIAAASILAKVTRDKIMTEIDRQYPEYQFAKNKGYGTKDHLDALEKHGRTPFHRLSFSPVNQF